MGPFGSLALAGYGVGSRLEYLQIPLVFGLGSALVTMVGTNIGAGQHARARRIMWSGAAVATVLTGTIGVAAALAPDVWLGLFSQDPDVLAAGRAYLRTVGPAYGFFGLGLSLYFASQGRGVCSGRSSRASRGCPSPRSAAGSSCTGSAVACRRSSRSSRWRSSCSGPPSRWLCGGDHDHVATDPGRRPGRVR